MLKVIQAINIEVFDGKKLIFTTDYDRKINLTDFEEAFSARLDVPAGTALYRLPLGGIEESHNLYFISTSPIKVRPVPVGSTKDSVPDYELVEDTPNFFGAKISEFWLSNDSGTDAMLTILSTGKNA